MDPRNKDARPRPDLGIIASAYDAAMSTKAGLVAHTIFPVLAVASLSGTFQKIPLSEFLKGKGTDRAPGSAYSRSSTTYDKHTFDIVGAGHEHPVDDENASRIGEANAEANAVKVASLVVLNAREQVAVAKALGGSNTGAIAVKWNVPATATPKANVQTAAEAFYSKSGIRPNLLVIGYGSFLDLFNTAEIKGEFVYSTPVGSMPMEQKLALLANYFDVARVVVAGAPYDSANAGLPATLQNIWPNTKAGLYYVDPAADLQLPTYGHTFRLTDDGASTGDTDPYAGLIVEDYREEQISSTVFRVREKRDINVKFEDLAYVMTNLR